MNSTMWGFSSSSSDESESDEERPRSAIRTNTLFYKQYHRGEYGDEWPSVLQRDSVLHNRQPPNNVQGNSSVLINGNLHASTSFANISLIPGLNDSHRIVSPSLLENTDPDIVLVDEGGKYRPIRVIPKELILRISPDDKPKLIKKETPNDDIHVPTKEIPLEQIDLIDFPKDPRKPKREEEQFYDGKEDGFALPLPRFWRETILQSAKKENQKRNLNGQYKRSLSHVRERKIEQTKRLSLVPPRTDPRLDRSLFTAPRKVISPPKMLNKSQPNVGSIFDHDEDAVNISSPSLSTSDKSSDSLPSFEDNLFNDKNSTKLDKDVDMDSLSDDNDCSFSAFQKRKMASKSKRPVAKRPKYEESTSNEDVKVPPIMIDLKAKKVSPVAVHQMPRKRNSLFGKPPRIDKDAILSALTDDATVSEDQENIDSVNAKDSIKLVKKSPKTKQTKKAQKTKVVAGGAIHFRLPPSKKREIVGDSVKSNRQKSKVQPKIEEKPIQIEFKPDQIEDKPDAKSNDVNILYTVETVKHTDRIETLSESSNSIGSIEQRLAEMTSPVKKESQTEPEQNESLTDILDDDTVKLAKQIEENIQSDQIIDINFKVAEPIIEASVDSGIQTAAESSDSTDPTPSEEIIDKKNDAAIVPITITESETVPEQPKSVIVQPNRMAEVNGLKNIDEGANCDNKAFGTDDTVITAPDEHANEMDISLDVISANLTSGTLPDIGANAEIQLGEIAHNLLYSNLDLSSTEDLHRIVAPEQQTKPQRMKVVVDDYCENENILVMESDVEISDDDYEEDQPCSIDELTLPTLDEDRNSVDVMKTKCDLCSFDATKGFKELTKHYMRVHPGKEISTSRLSSYFNPQELMVNPFTPVITNCHAETMIKSLCYICNLAYNMSSSKWLQHFIAHTGEFEFRCNKCSKDVMQDLHKKCLSKENQRIRGPHDFIDNVLYGYVCTQCSFVQLSKQNVIQHLDTVHQQIQNEDNVIEIILLQCEMPKAITDFIDNKNNSDLIEAMQHVSSIYQPDRYQNCSPFLIPSDDDEVETDSHLAENTIDLTLSDDDY